jgi:hypothetical protein
MHEVKMATPRKRSAPSKQPAAASADSAAPKARRKAAVSSAAPTHHDIAVRAYEIYLRRGGGHGDDWDDWLCAERELFSMS